MTDLMPKARTDALRLIPPGGRVVVAVSGGPDSVALLHLLHDLKEDGDYRLHVAHLDHMTRGGESAKDARFVAGLARDLGLEFAGRQVNVEEERKKTKTSFQQAARFLRYRFLEETAAACGAGRIALGHTADDQAETFLINLLRGSGAKGLGGMAERRGKLVRPLLSATREEVLDYLNRRGLAYREDSSNREPRYLRNRIRLELLPQLQRFNPQIRHRLVDTALLLREDEEFLEQEARRLLERAMQKTGAGGLLIEIDPVRACSPVLQRRMVRGALERMRGDLRRITREHVVKVLELFEAAGAEKQIHLPGNIAAVRRPGVVEFCQIPSRGSRIQQKEPVSTPPAAELNVPGWTDLAAAGFRFKAELRQAEGVDWERPERHQAFLDYDQTGAKLRVRFFRPGDRFVPLGMTGTKKLKSFFNDHKVPRPMRSRIPVLTTQADSIIWVFGWRIAENYRVTSRTRTILCLEGWEIP